ncbi:hypothetical protein HORIV_60430 [Vreelandella olivaria]|uniref:Uncharacterized protein n=1 Tax=Vreelandella olivaria TaxID=390919 RepID=A0ABM7GS38_9GAMM|nr:hypothetical protein HORIV_60430 [Halomonas olivaria]
MDPITLGIIVAIALIALMAIGTPIAFALGGVSLLALIYDRGLSELTYFGETFLTASPSLVLSPFRCLF